MVKAVPVRHSVTVCQCPVSESLSVCHCYIYAHIYLLLIFHKFIMHVLVNVLAISSEDNSTPFANNQQLEKVALGNVTVQQLS